jgi:Tfp pilus assembly protein FimT
MVRNFRGYTAVEMVTVAAVIGIMMAMSAPSLIKANQNYKINAAGQEITQALQGTRFEAIRRNAVNNVMFDRAASIINVYSTTVNPANGNTTVKTTQIPLGAGIVIEGLPNGMTAPTIVTSAFSIRSTFGDTDYKNLSSSLVCTSLPLDNVSTSQYRATFTSRGIPASKAGTVEDPGIVHWFYIRNANYDRRAITITSTGSTQVWKWGGSSWVAIST